MCIRDSIDLMPSLRSLQAGHLERGNSPIRAEDGFHDRSIRFAQIPPSGFRRKIVRDKAKISGTRRRVHNLESKPQYYIFGNHADRRYKTKFPEISQMMPVKLLRIVNSDLTDAVAVNGPWKYLKGFTGFMPD